MFPFATQLKRLALCLMIFSPLSVHQAWADEVLSFELTIQSGHFFPEIIEVPADKKFRLIITNLGPGPEEFESTELRKEKVLAEGVTRNIVFYPLKPGEYKFFGEFHLETAQGSIVVK